MVLSSNRLRRGMVEKSVGGCHHERRKHRIRLRDAAVIEVATVDLPCGPTAGLAGCTVATVGCVVGLSHSAPQRPGQSVMGDLSSAMALAPQTH